MKKIFVLASALSMSAFISACSGPAHNPPPPPMAHDGMWQHDHQEHMRMMTQYYFDQMDANGDGVVSYKEFMAFQKAKFREADTNHDGQLTLDEVTAQEKREKHKMMDWKRSQGDDMHDNMHQEMNNQDRSMEQNRDMNQGDYMNNQNSSNMNQGNRY